MIEPEARAQAGSRGIPTRFRALFSAGHRGRPLQPGDATSSSLSRNTDNPRDGDPRHRSWPASVQDSARFSGLVPRTMVALIACSTMLSMAPLLAMLALSGAALDRLLIRGEQLVADAQHIEVQGAGLQDDIRDLQRAGRQYLVLHDSMLLEVIESRVQSITYRAEQLLRPDLAEDIQAPARRLLDGINTVHQEWFLRKPRHIPQAEFMSLMRMLSVDADRAVTEGRLSIYDQVRELKRRSELTRQRVSAATLLAVPLTFLVAWILSRIITLPLQGLRAAVSALGTTNYETPISIRYPRELARLGDKLEWLRVRLRELQADKDRFLRHVSHELKTPLASLREGTDLLLEQSLGSLTPTQTEVTHILAESAQDLDAQVRNLLAYAEWRSGQQAIEMTWIDTRILVDEVVRAHRLTLTKRRLQITYDLRTPELYGSRLTLRVCLSNLLNNAIKHAPRGSAIDIVADRDSVGCTLSVRDRGRGVPVADRERILEPFVRGAEPEESGVRGTGIGLSIVSETAKAHGGVLEVSDAEPGACFTLCWPCSPAGNAAA